MIIACGMCGGVMETAAATGILTMLTLLATECWNRLRYRLAIRNTTRDQQ